MLPAHASHNAPNRLSAGAISDSKFAGIIAGHIFSTNVENLCLGKFMMCISFALWRMVRAVANARAKPRPALCRPIFVIVGLCSKKEVIRVYARGIIAVMKNGHSIWNRAIVQYPRNTVRSLVFPVYANAAIAIGVSITSPEPASIGLLDPAKQSSFYGFLHASIVS
jgi:hypothetical protein